MGSESKAFPSQSLKLLVEQKVIVYSCWRLTESRQTETDGVGEMKFAVKYLSE